MPVPEFPWREHTTKPRDRMKSKSGFIARRAHQTLAIATATATAATAAAAGVFKDPREDFDFEIETDK
ncbi:hypothetical protein HZH68_004225 [Vespula germanica]|uniref:Uncharacterized protein n=1 Tax=Vespula germanica TaxID=30212 RepID=A0A836UUH8_VESGE|nr:hypothetical protein HZH68_004225 [Vespula germanica]